MSRRVAWTGLLLAALAATAGSAAAPVSQGVATCASSLCHGSVRELTASDVRQDEYVTWSRLDKHARAFAVLRNARSQRIAAKLGLAQPAHEAKVCLDCHADNVPAAQRGERFQLSDGVGCEACHGAAERWLASHVQADASHARNLGHGLVALEQPRVRAERCLDCHVGNREQFVSHRMMAAGHPRLSFELDTFTAIAPAHHRVDADYRTRKPGAADGASAWAIGQALAVARQLQLLADPVRGRDGLFPELVHFDCHACHHPMSQQRWAPRRAFGDSGPGQVRLNDSGLLMLRAVARSLDPALGRQFSEQARRLHAATAGGGDALAEAGRLRQQALALATRIEQQPLPADGLRAVALALVDEGLAGHYPDYAGAEQAVMAIASVVDALHRGGGAVAPTPVNAELSALLASLRDDEAYDPARFRRQLRSLRQHLAKAEQP